MKQLIMAFWLLPAMASAVGAENYFREGTKWEYYGEVYWDMPKYHIYNCEWIEGERFEAGYTCYNLWFRSAKITDSSVEEREPLVTAVVRSEGNKVYFLPSVDAEEWLLLYDFDLQPGESAEVFYPLNMYWERNKYVGSYTVTCTRRVEPADEGGLPEIYVSEEQFPDVEQLWLVGAGSLYGPTTQAIPGITDMIPLKCISNGEKVIYGSPVKPYLAIDRTVGDAPGIAVKNAGNAVEVTGAPVGSRVEVYSAAGVCVGARSASDSAVRVEVPSAGVYIVRAGCEAVSVMVE